MPTTEQHIIINDRDGIVTLEGKSLYLDERLDSKGYVDLLQANTRRDPGLLPPGVRWISGDNRFVIVDEAPRIRNVSVRMDNSQGSHAVESEFEGTPYHVSYDTTPELQKRYWKTYALPVPWVTYGICADPYYPKVLFIAVTGSQWRNAGAKLGYLPLPNLYYDSSICYPKGMQYAKGLNAESSVSEVVNVAIEEFWASSFNNEVTEYRSSQLWGNFAYHAGRDPMEVDYIFRFWESKPLDWIIIQPWYTATTVNKMMMALEELRDKTYTHLSPEITFGHLYRKLVPMPQLFSVRA